MHLYRIINIQNKNGNIIEKFIMVDKDGWYIMDGLRYIYLNKDTGNPISRNGKKYKVNNSTKKLLINRNMYILENNDNSDIIRRASTSIVPPVYLS